jgi:hypothetical protein
LKKLLFQLIRYLAQIKNLQKIILRKTKASAVELEPRRMNLSLN